jgi:hypothetical protein
MKVLLATASLIVLVASCAGTKEASQGNPAQAACSAPSVRPTYLPWIESNGAIPEPLESYDAEIDRAQLAWSNPNFPEGEAGVGLTVYTHSPQGNRGDATDIVVQGVAGRLHGPGDGGDVSVSWDLGTARCNYMELTLADRSLGSARAVAELVKVGESLA